MPIGGGLPPWVHAVLAGSDAEVVLSRANAPYLLNVLWPLGLANRAAFNADTATGVDYFVSGYHRPSPYPVLKAPPARQMNSYDKVYPRVSIASAGAALTEGNWKFYAEGMGYWATDDRDDDVSRILIGAKYRETRLANSLGLDEITPVLE